MKNFFFGVFFIFLTLPAIPLSATEMWREHVFDVQHYRIAVSLDISNRFVYGRATLKVRSLRDNLDTLRLDAEDMFFREIIIDGKSVNGFRVDKKQIVIPLYRKYMQNDTFTVTMDYVAEPRKGLYFYSPDEKNPDAPVQVWSQGEGTDNHHWFPAYDYPNDKATMEIVATVDSGLTAVSNGRLESVENVAGKTVFRYKFDHPAPAYLISLIVGKYTKYEERYRDIPVEYYVYPEYSEEDALRSFGRTPDMLEFFSDYTGFDYPYCNYTQTLIYDFMYSGMENISSTTITDRTMHDESAGLVFSSDGLVAHELAHQWFGDLVTCREWGDMWLNEGFATIFTDLYMEHLYGRDEYRYRMWKRNQQPVIRAESEKPRTLAGKESWGVYIKGASVLHMLRQRLGDKLFRAGIRKYLHTFAFANAETHDLRRVMENTTGYNLYTFFEQWVFGRGIPEFKITSEYDEKKDSLKLVIKQVQDSVKIRPAFDLHLKIGLESGGKYREYPIELSKRIEVFSFSVPAKPTLVIFDAGQNILKTVKTDKSADEWIYQLKNAPELADRLYALQRLAEDKKDALKSEIVEAVLETCETARYYGLRIEAVRALEKITVPSGAEKERINSKLLEYLSGEKDFRVKKEIIKALAGYPGPSTRISLNRVIKENKSCHCTAEAFNSLIAIDTVEAGVFINEALKMDSWDELIRASAFKNLRYLSDSLRITLDKKYVFAGAPAKLRRIAAEDLIVLLKKGNKDAADILLEVVKENHESNRYRPVSRAVGALARHRETRSRLRPLLEELRKGYMNRYVRQSVSGAVKYINENDD